MSPTAAAALLDAAAAPGAWDMLNALGIPIVCLDPSDVIRRANLAAENFFNVSLVSHGDRSLASLVPSDSPLIALVRETRLSRASYAEYAVELELMGGARAVADIVVAPMHEHDDWLLLTVQSRSVAQMINRQLTHQGAARSVVGVAAMLAHEIKNPLSGIRGAAQLLEDSADPDNRELTRLICTEVDRIKALVDRMETFSDTRPMERQSENIHAILGHVRRVAASGFAGEISIKERYDPSLPPVLANRDKLIQAFLNLVKNAAEAAGKSGEIQITTAYRHGVRVAVKGASRRISLPLEVCVIDNGPGAPDELVEHMFEPFVTAKPGGSGLGLALVAKVIGDHGGVIEYDRLKDPARTVFRVLLPMHREDPR
jgi:two-component system, NtrC family, nitrogen regulation sensor histidine kinase GlnL